jgi:hypothetical protein
MIFKFLRKAKKSPITQTENTHKKGKPHRIQKGERLPGAGRPLGSHNLKAAFEAIASLDYGEVHFPGGITRKLTGLEKVAKVIYDKAKEGDLRAADMYLDRAHGKVPLPIKQIGDGSGRVHINIVRSLKDKENPSVEVKTEHTEPADKT